MRIAAAVIGGLFALGFLAAEPPDTIERPIAITVRPIYMLTRGDIRIEIRIPPDVDNRLMVLAWDSMGGSAGETRRPIDGENGPVLHVVELRSQPPARYVFVASLYGQRGEFRGQASAEIHTVDEGGR